MLTHLPANPTCNGRGPTEVRCPIARLWRLRAERPQNAPRHRGMGNFRLTDRSGSARAYPVPREYGPAVTLGTLMPSSDKRDLPNHRPDDLTPRRPQWTRISPTGREVPAAGIAANWDLTGARQGTPPRPSTDFTKARRSRRKGRCPPKGHLSVPRQFSVRGRVSPLP
jgi:hypothetical protein